jgi:MFS family permease
MSNCPPSRHMPASGSATPGTRPVSYVIACPSTQNTGVMGLSGARLGARRATRALASATQSGAHAGAVTARGVVRVIHRMTAASGAGRTGLDRLIELTAGGSAGDAFVAVALAGTLFFSASVTQARGHVALALVVTMAPFAVLAPLIGPALDRMQQGRRYILIGTLLARGLLCWGMSGAVQHNDAFTLLPAAFGVLVLQKVYGVTRSAVTPRLLPAQITLVSANARTALASLIASTLGAGAAAGIDVLAGGGSGGAAWVLRLGTLVYFAAIALGIRLPDQVDQPHSPAPAAATAHGMGVGLAPGPGPGRGHGPGSGDGPEPGREPRPGPGPGHRPGYGPEPGREPRPGPGSGRTPGYGQGAAGTKPMPRRTPKRVWWAALRDVGPVVGEAMRGNAALRAFSGFMVFFLAFLLRIEHFPGVNDTVALAGMIAAAAAGGFIGTALGAALRSRTPHLIMFVMLGLSAVITAVCAAFFGLWAALAVALVAAFGQVLGKLALDSIVQREIREEIRSSTLAASETIHQMSWVAGGLAGLAMSITASGIAGLTVAATGLAAAFVLLLAARRRRILAARHLAPQAVR